MSQVISNFSGHPPHHLHLADDSGLSSSDSEVEARDDKILDDTSVETNVTEDIKSGDDIKDTSNPFECSDNEEEDTVLDHIKLSDSKGESKESGSKSVQQNLPDSHNNQVGFEGEQVYANSDLKSTSKKDTVPHDEEKEGTLKVQSCFPYFFFTNIVQ